MEFSLAMIGHFFIRKIRATFKVAVSQLMRSINIRYGTEFSILVISIHFNMTMVHKICQKMIILHLLIWQMSFLVGDVSVLNLFSWRLKITIKYRFKIWTSEPVRQMDYKRPLILTNEWWQWSFTLTPFLRQNLILLSYKNITEVSGTFSLRDISVFISTVRSAARNIKNSRFNRL